MTDSSRNWFKELKNKIKRLFSRKPRFRVDSMQDIPQQTNTQVLPVSSPQPLPIAPQPNIPITASENSPPKAFRILSTQQNPITAIIQPVQPVAPESIILTTATENNLSKAFRILETQQNPVIPTTQPIELPRYDLPEGVSFRVDAQTIPKVCPICRGKDRISRATPTQWKCNLCDHTWNSG